MRIKVSGLKSSLSYSDSFTETTEAFIAAINGLNEGIVLERAGLSDYDCDLKLIYIESGGSEDLFLQNLDVLREPFYLLTNGMNNSLAASMEILTYMNLHGMKGEIIHGDIDYVAGRISLLAAAGRLKRQLAASCFGVLGQPSDWLISSIPAYDEVYKGLGVELEDISLDEVRDEYEACTVVDFAELPGEFDKDEKLKALRAYTALKKVVARYGLDGFTVRCFDLLKPLKTTGCVGLALLNEAGITATCEGDIAAMLTMHIARLITGQNSFQANPSRISTKENTVVFAHCTLPLGMADGFTLDSHFESGTGIAVRGRMRKGEVTVLRIASNLKRYFVSDGELLDNLEEKDLCRTQILVKLEKPVSELLTKPCGNHHVIIYGHHAEQIGQMLNILLNIE